MRVPVPTGSVTDLTVQLEDAGHRATRSTPRSRRPPRARSRAILAYTEDPIVSSRHRQRPGSCTFDSALTKANGNMVKVVGWYDNEWGYSNRLVDLITLRRQVALTHAMKTVDDLISADDLRGRRVFVRADLNVPLDADGTITDDGRIRASLPTIKALAEAGARVVVCAHLGRPKGAPDPSYSLAPGRRAPRRAARRRGRLRHRHGRRVRPAVVAGLGDGEVALLENLRFNAGETSQGRRRARRVRRPAGRLADVYVGDGFGAVHRKHATVYDVPRGCRTPPATSCQAEVEVLKRLTDDPSGRTWWSSAAPRSPTSSASSTALLQGADRLLIGGGMAYTFLEAQGYEVGSSLLEEDQVGPGQGYLRAGAGARRRARPAGRRRGRRRRSPRTPSTTVVAADAIPADWMGLDIGPETREAVRVEDRRRRAPSSGTARWASSSTPFAEGTRRSPRRSPR